MTDAVRLFIVVPALLSVAAFAGPQVKDDAFPRVAPTLPADAAKTFQLRKGLRLELVASEPLVESPVGICFDEDGRMFVVEMCGYPDRREEKLGRIKMLEDTQGNGRYDKATVFADQLPWPTSAAYSDGGLLVTASPDLLRLKDTDGSGHASQKQVVFTGFAGTMNPLNVQGLVNGLVWGIDGRFHLAASFNGGSITRVGSDDKPIDLHGRDLAFDPRTLATSIENGGGQHGLSFDSWGRKFVCMNSKPIQTFLYDARYAGRNPLAAMPTALTDIYADGPDVFRISPGEAWRELRTRLRVAGKVKGPIENGGRASGYFTGVSGITLYTGDALPAEFADNAFIGEVANNLVHRMVIQPRGVGVMAHRAADEGNAEFLASTDIWFRPVQMANGPDGALYIVDMYRETIEHPWSLPDEIRQHLDLHSGMERGRIWRVVPDGFVPRKPPHLSKATTEELVSLLAHPNGWHRDTAARLLGERHDPAAIPLLTKLSAQSNVAQGRLRAIAMLQTLAALNESHLLAALKDSDAHVREQAVLLSEKFLASEHCPAAIWERIRAMADDPSLAVRYQLAFSLGESRQADRIEPLARIARRDINDPGIGAAILSSIGGNEAALFGQLSAMPEVRTNPEGQKLLQKMAALIGQRGIAADVASVVRLIETSAPAEDPGGAFSLARALREGIARSYKSRVGASTDMTGLISRARATAMDDNAPSDARSQAILLLGTTNFADSSTTILPMLDARQSQVHQLAAIAALDQFEDQQVAPELIRRFVTFSPQVRSAVLAALVKRPDRAMALLYAVQSGAIRSGDLPSAQASFLRRHSDAHVKALAANLLAPAGGNRAPIVSAFQPALDLTGDAAHGHLIYQQRCIACHRLASEGFAVGPDLTTVRPDGKAKTLVNILDPNREVAPNYVAYLVETRGGESLVGVVTETAASVTVRQPFGKETVVLRSDIKRIESQRLSLMPENLEEGLKPQELADLLEYVFTAPAARQ